MIFTDSNIPDLSSGKMLKASKKIIEACPKVAAVYVSRDRHEWSTTFGIFDGKVREMDCNVDGGECYDSIKK